MKKTLFFLAFCSSFLLLATNVAAQESKNVTPINGKIARIVVNGRAKLTLKPATDSSSPIITSDTAETDHTYNPATGEFTLNSGRATLTMAIPSSLTFETYSHARIKIPEGDTILADRITMITQDFSRVIIDCPINSDTVTAFSFGHSSITLDALEGYVINLSEKEFSHINIDRRSLFIKHYAKKRNRFLGIF